MTRRILHVVTNVSRYADPDEPTGLWLSELTHAYDLFETQGYEQRIVSPRGGVSPLEPRALKWPLLDASAKAWLDDPARMRLLSETARPEDVDPSRFDVIYFTGGHAVMWDFPDDAGLQHLARAVWERGGIVSSVCHGYCGLLNVRLGDGTLLVAGKRVTGFAWSEEVVAGVAGKVPYNADAAAVASANRDVIVGIKVRVGKHASGRSGTQPLDIALEVAEEVGLPMMVHIDHPPPSYEEVLRRLRPGDVLTHAFRPFPNTPLDRFGKIKPAVLEARERGVLFDIGHGKGSLAFRTARGMLENGFQPDVISSDIHVLCVDGPVFDLPTTLSKFVCLGMPLGDVIAAATAGAAKALQRPDLGTLSPGAIGDATVLSLEEGSHDYVDSTGETMIGRQRLRAEGLILGGKWWHGRDNLMPMAP